MTTAATVRDAPAHHYIPAPPLQHCAECAVEWRSLRDGCWNCGGEGAPGYDLSARWGGAGTWTASKHDATGWLL